MLLEGSIQRHGIPGDEIVQVYCCFPESEKLAPLKTLVGISYFPSLSDSYTEYGVYLDMDFLKRWDSDKKEYSLPKGEYTFFIGASSEDIRIEIPYMIE